MFKIYASEYHEAVAILHNVIGLITNGAVDRHAVISALSKASTGEQLKKLKGHAVKLQCQVTALGIDTAISTLSIDKYLTYFGCGQLLIQISQNFQNELSLKSIYLLDYKKADCYEQKEPLFGILVNAQFPSISYDIEQSGKCYACELDTASVFHSVRTLEAVMRAIARCLKIPDPTKAKDRNWTEALKPINAEITARWPNSTSKLSGDGKEFDEIYASLVAIQNPYRNSTMHLDKKYTAAEALYLLKMVEGLILRVSERMDENGLPLA